MKTKRIRTIKQTSAKKIKIGQLCDWHGELYMRVYEHSLEQQGAITVAKMDTGEIIFIDEPKPVTPVEYDTLSWWRREE